MNDTFDPKKTLFDLILALDLDPLKIGVEDLQEVANRLSVLAHHQPAWGWRYLRNVLNGKIKASQKLLDAMLRLGAVIDSTPLDLASSVKVSVQAAGKVRSGALVLADSRPCANPGCRIEFVPRTPNQACHSSECARIYRRLKRQARQAGQKYKPKEEYGR